jgi:hypothetical protein
VSVEANGRGYPNGYASERRIKMNLPMKRRNVEIVVETRGVSSLLDQPVESLMIGRVATGVEGA